MKRAMLIAAGLWMLSAGTARPIDSIYVPGKDKEKEKVYTGKIMSMSATVINFQPQRTGPSEIQANEITRIVFENSPGALTNAQKAILDGRYEDAIEALKKEVPEDHRKEVAEEIVYCRAYCAAELALSGAADPNDAEKQMSAFIANSPNSFHILKACELLGDIDVTLGKVAEAQKCYAKLSLAPWPDYKIRAQVALGRAYLAQDKAADADKAFDEALNIDASGDLAEIQRTAARIGKARCMVLTGKADAAIRSLTEIIDRPEERTPEINAMAYNALGTALRKAGKPKEAIFAFLRVHLLYFTQPDLDAEAVANLKKLFAETHRSDHEREMQDILDHNYKNSRWAKGVK